MVSGRRGLLLGLLAAGLLGAAADAPAQTGTWTENQATTQFGRRTFVWIQEDGSVSVDVSPGRPLIPREPVGVNPQLFASLCSTTVGSGSTLASGACAWSSPFTPPLAIPLRPLNPDGSRGALLDPIRCSVDPLGLQPLLGRRFGGYESALLPAGGSARFCRRDFPAGGVLPTPDDTLTGFQQALLGCAPFSGARCKGFAALLVDDRQPHAWYLQTIVPAQGGINFANVEARALEQSWPRAVVRWTTLGTRVQPGTVPVYDPLLRSAGGVDFGRRSFAPACARPDGAGGLLTLPGCRGIEQVLVSRNPDQEVTGVTIAFEDGYDPAIDGCLVGGGDRRSDPLGAIGNIGGVDVFLAPNANGYSPGWDSLESCHEQGPLGSDWLWHPLAGCLSEERARQVADPEAGVPDTGVSCGSQWVDGVLVPRSFEERFADANLDGIPDIEQEFLGTLERVDCEPTTSRCDVSLPSAQLFQNELAAASWNLLQFLVSTSCDAAVDGTDVVAADPECFDRGSPFRADRCSFNAPHLCLNVRSLRDSSVPMEIDVVPGSRRNRLVTGSQGLVAVVVFGSDVAPVTAIDPASLALGPDGAAPVDREGPRYRDWNDDGMTDLIAQYRIRETGLKRGDEEACLRGRIAGFPFEGCDGIHTRGGRRDGGDDEDDDRKGRPARDDDAADDHRRRNDRGDRDDDRDDRGRGRRSDRDD